MKKKSILLYIFFILNNSILFGAENSNIIYRPATSHDIAGLIELMKTHTEADRKKLIIFPYKLMSTSFEDSINKNHIFVAENEQTKQIIAFTEIFLIEEITQLNNTLEELGYLPNKMEIDSTMITSEHNYQQRKPAAYNYVPNIKNVNINLNLDFTHPNYRNKGHNKKLANFAFKHMQPKIADYIKNNQSNEMVLLYGLSYPNDYFINKTASSDVNKKDHKPGIESRTPGIAYSYALFVQSLTKNNALPNINHQRVVTFMPMFDIYGTDNQPLPQDNWVLSSGNVLSCHIK